MTYTPRHVRHALSDGGEQKPVSKYRLLSVLASVKG